MCCLYTVPQNTDTQRLTYFEEDKQSQMGTNVVCLWQDHNSDSQDTHRCMQVTSDFALCRNSQLGKVDTTKRLEMRSSHQDSKALAEQRLKGSSCLRRTDLLLNLARQADKNSPKTQQKNENENGKIVRKKKNEQTTKHTAEQAPLHRLVVRPA